MKNQIHLEKVNWDNYEKVLKLRVTKEQKILFQVIKQV